VIRRIIKIMIIIIRIIKILRGIIIKNLNSHQSSDLNNEKIIKLIIADC